jgi:hypothetical protein
MTDMRMMKFLLPRCHKFDDFKDENDVDTYDLYVGANMRGPIGGEILSGKVVWRKRDLDGTVRGGANDNSMLDTITYEIEFPDGCSDEYTANVIAENMYAQCDTEVRKYNLMEGIIDQKIYGHAIYRADMYITWKQQASEENNQVLALEC